MHIDEYILSLYNILKIQINLVYLVNFCWKEREADQHLKELNRQEGSPNDIIYFLMGEKGTEVGVQVYGLSERMFQQLQGGPF